MVMVVVMCADVWCARASYHSIQNEQLLVKAKTAIESRKKAKHSLGGLATMCCLYARNCLAISLYPLFPMRCLLASLGPNLPF